MFDEKPEDLAELTAEYHELYSPADAKQRFLVDTLVASEWRLRRTRRVEAELWQTASNAFLVKNIETTITCTSGDAFATDSATFERLQRVVNSCERTWHRAGKELQRLQEVALAHGLPGSQPEAEPVPTPSPAPQPQPQPPKPTSANMGSIRQNPKTPGRAVPQPPLAPTPTLAETSTRPSDRFPTSMETVDAAPEAIFKQK
jgi:hypothetical protein